MRLAVWLLAIAALAVAEPSDEPWVEEEDLEEPYNEETAGDPHDRRRRDTYGPYDEETPGDPYDRRRRETHEPYVEESPGDPHDRRRRDTYEPYEEHARVKRRCSECYEPDYRRAEYRRVPRQVHQYEVYEFTDESSYPSPPYEEMLAASANHYHSRVYAGAPAAARYLDPEVSAPPILGVPSSPVHFARSVDAAASLTPVHKASVSVNVPVSFKTNRVSSNSHSPVQFIASNVAPVPIFVPDPAAIARAPVVGPVPVSSEPLSQPLRSLDGGDQVLAAGHHHQKHHGHSGHSAGGGHSKHEKHHGEHGGKSSKGYHSHHHVDKGGKGHKTDEKHRKEYEEAAGKKKKHHDEADHKGDHEEEAHGHRGAHFDEKKGHKKGHKTKGYHNKYHKDEFHKEHKFYDDFHKSGEHHRFGKFHAKHASNEGGKKKAHHVNAGHDSVERGKKGYSNKGHVDADHKGYKGGHGNEEHHESHSEHGKKGGSQGGKHWGHAN